MRIERNPLQSLLIWLTLSYFILRKSYQNDYGYGCITKSTYPLASYLPEYECQRVLDYLNQIPLKNMYMDDNVIALSCLCSERVKIRVRIEITSEWSPYNILGCEH